MLDETGALDTQPQNGEQNLSPLEPRPTLTIPELTAAAQQTTERYGSEPEFRITQDLETKHAQQLLEAVAKGEITLEEASTIIGARMAESRMASDVDYLTDLYNRGGGMKRLVETLYLGNRNSTPTSLMMIDLDEFKPVNDALGHEAGDRAIQATGGHLKLAARTSDIPFRYGGDEFAVVLPNTELEQASVVAKRINDDASGSIESATEAFGFQLPKPVTFSAGVAEVTELGKGSTIEESAADLVRRADKASRVAKFLGKNRVVLAREIDGEEIYFDKSSGINYTITEDEKGKITGANTFQQANG